MYTFKNTEINNNKASEFETKSLLYLLGMRKDSNEIEYITIDCFNDVTALNSNCSKLWDVQSKNHKSLPPSKIGASLYTLYDNFISAINFEDYILFIPKLDRNYLIDKNLHCYTYNNINDKTKKGIEKKLKEEILRVNPTYSSPPLFDAFLNNITFIEDNKQISTYIKQISNFKNKKDFSKELYESIFNEIRNKQSILKNSYIENKTISHVKEVLTFNRHITKDEINTLLISRFIGVDIFSFKGIPIDFVDVIKDITDIEEIKDLLLDCQSNLARAFFNKNESKNFWNISEQLIKLVKNDFENNIFDIYDKLKNIVKNKSEYLTDNTILYMTALVKEGLNDN